MTFDRAPQTDRGQCWRGTACINIDDFSFSTLRPYRDKDQPNHLVSVFERAGCGNLKRENAIVATIPEHVLVQSLRLSGLTLVDLTGDRSPPPRLYIPYGSKVRILDGWLRADAAKSYFPARAEGTADIVWAVDLYVDVLEQQTQQEFAERFLHEKGHPYGEIVHQIDRYGEAGKREDADRWRSRLPPYLIRDLQRLSEHTDLYRTFCEILSIPGQRSGFRLPILRKVLAGKAFEYYLRYAKLILRTFRHIYKTHGDLLLHADDATIETLQARAPGLCENDKEYIRDRVGTGKCFGHVADPATRQILLKNALSIDYRIPTLSTFFEDSLQFLDWSSLIRDLLSLSADTTVDEGLLANFTSSSHGQLYVQVDASRLRVYQVHEREQQRLAAYQLWLFAARESASLGKDKPRCGRRHHSTFDGVTRCPHAWRSFAQLAHELGFSSKTIQARRQVITEAHLCPKFLTAQGQEEKAELTTAMPGEDYGRRFGRLREEGYLYDRQHLFLPTLAALKKVRNTNVTSLFIRVSQLEAYLGTGLVDFWLPVLGADGRDIDVPYCTDAAADPCRDGSEDLESQAQEVSVIELQPVVQRAEVGPPQIESTSDQRGENDVLTPDQQHAHHLEQKLQESEARLHLLMIQEKEWELMQRAWTDGKADLEKSCHILTMEGKSLRMQVQMLEQQLDESQQQLTMFKSDAENRFSLWENEKATLVARADTLACSIGQPESSEEGIRQDAEEGTKATVVALQAALSESREDVRSRERENAQREATIRDLEQARDSDRQEAQQQLQQLHDELDRLKQDIDHGRDAHSQMRTTLSDKDAQIAQQSETIRDLQRHKQEQYEDLLQQTNKIKKDYDQLQQDLQQQETVVADWTIQHAHELESYRQQAKSSQQQLEHKQAAIQSLESDMARHQSAHQQSTSSLANDVDIKQARIVALEHELSVERANHQKSMDTAGLQREEIQKHLQSLQHALDVEKSEHDAAKTMISEYRSMARSDLERIASERDEGRKHKKSNPGSEKPDRQQQQEVRKRSAQQVQKPEAQSQKERQQDPGHERQVKVEVLRFVPGSNEPTADFTKMVDESQLTKMLKDYSARKYILKRSDGDRSMTAANVLDQVHRGRLHHVVLAPRPWK